MKICRICSKIAENSTADYAMRITTKEIISIRRKINSFYEINWEIISKMTPDAPIAHPR